MCVSPIIRFKIRSPLVAVFLMDAFYICIRKENNIPLESRIRIGIDEQLWSAAWLEALILPLKGQLPNVEIHSSAFDQLHPSLLRGDLDAVAHPLHLCPVVPPDGIAYSALLPREEPVSTLLIRPGAHQATALFQLKDNAKVYAPHPTFSAQLLDFRPDLELTPRKEHADAIVLGPFEAKYPSDPILQLISVPLNPREVCPPPGSGAIVFQTCADDLPMRRSLKPLHHPETSALTNVERKVLRILGGNLREPLGVFCERDRMGNYQVWVCHAPDSGQTLIRERLASSTVFELAERVAARIKPA